MRELDIGVKRIQQGKRQLWRISRHDLDLRFGALNVANAEVVAEP